MVQSYYRTPPQYPAQLHRSSAAPVANPMAVSYSVPVPSPKVVQIAPAQPAASTPVVVQQAPSQVQSSPEPPPVKEVQFADSPTRRGEYSRRRYGPPEDDRRPYPPYYGRRPPSPPQYYGGRRTPYYADDRYGYYDDDYYSYDYDYDYDPYYYCPPRPRARPPPRRRSPSPARAQPRCEYYDEDVRSDVGAPAAGPPGQPRPFSMRLDLREGYLNFNQE
uniref:Uncharacterized protein n=1 Tax=Chromera velia CCMP2878 TaxID=1169474 RepID=A0A0G4HZL3_9ALVE|eukprot:Cvel_1571.t1-p1 / transcript=Cvel_1571.t1 / gene=Cvel_1571 / organism=Chromera_velia_CCMP2878 / gene_product=hypothetical protein / transcript_product=hypothetical protein / location=Cvel_scaffold56:25480-27522(+) / protein_length=218 / sequence_SO=supercontig / SO=protein_coding / is_pseudo=false